MNLPDVSAWLASDRDFKQGVALYAALGTSTTYQRLFGLGATDYSCQVLVRELSALVPTVALEQAPVPPAPAAAPLEPAPAPEPLAAASPGLEAIAAASARRHVQQQLLDELAHQLKAVRDERSHIHAQLTAPNLGKKARLKHALRIVELTKQEGKLKALAAHVQQHGRLPGPVATGDVTDEAELRRRLLNLRSRRSKLKDKPEKLAAIEAEITLILSKITT
jgi:hypothetical protein